MGVWAKMLLRDTDVDGAGQTQDYNIPYNNIKYLDICSRALATGAVTLANLKHSIPMIKVKLGGIEICEIQFRDLIHLNSKWMGRTPQGILVGATADYADKISARLPLFIEKWDPQGRGLRECSAQFQYADLADADGEELDVKVTYRDRPFTERNLWHLAYHTFHGTGAASVMTNISRQGAELIGILVWNCNISREEDVDGGESPEVSELKLIVDNREVYHSLWTTALDDITPHDLLFDNTNWSLMAIQEFHYQWYSFEEEPWPANNLWVETNNTALFGEGTPGNGAFRLICVYIEP